MKVLHVNASDDGGAARAAIRLHLGLRRYGIDSQFVTIRTGKGPDALLAPLKKWQVAAAVGKRIAASRISSLQKTPTNPVIHSIGQFSSGLGRWIERSDFDIVNLHWVGTEALSISEIARISKPIVWTMHDMWSFMGAEHYDDLDHPNRWMAPYTAANRPPNYSGPDIDRYVWQQKAKKWRGREFHLVAPSHWLARCARASALMAAQPCEVIHNPIDTDTFAPIPKEEARRILGLPIDKKLILFGALSATSDQRKGYDLLVAALRQLEGQPIAGQDVEVVVFGGRKTDVIPGVSLNSHLLGVFHDDISLRLVYSAADLFVAPSRQDNLPNTLVEAGACGVPCVGFDIGGIPDIIVEGKTGLLAKAFDASELAGAIQQLLKSPMSRETVRVATKEKFALEATIPKYISLYQKLANHSSVQTGNR